MMPYITSEFERREPSDRPPVIPDGARNFALLGQYVEIPQDVVFTVEYSVRAAQMAVYQLLNIQREVPPVSAHDMSLEVQLKALFKVFQSGHSVPPMHHGQVDAAGNHVWHDTAGKPGRM
jgi:oleate hydratase